MKRFSFCMFWMAGALLCGLWSVTSAPAWAQDTTFCDVDPCSNVLCLGLGYDPNFEDDLRSLYTTLSQIPIIGGLIAVETADLDNNGMAEIAQARLFDAILSNRLAPNHCCVYTPYMTNLIAAEAIALAIVAVWPSDIYGIPMPAAPDSGLMARVVAALATSGQEELINTLLQTLASIIPNLPDIDYGVFDGSSEPYLAKNGDADTDDVCNYGEYQAWVVTAPNDYDAFVNAAINKNITDYYGGCPDCGEGAAEGSAEGAAEGQSEGETPCDIDSASNYYKVMILFGDTDHDLLLSKAEFQTIAPFVSIGWFLIDSNHDNYLSEGEFTGSSLLLSLMPDIDANEDNLFTLDELHKLSGGITQEQFTAMDFDQDGYINCDELNGIEPGPQGSCYAEGCHSPCQASAIQSGYEAALRNLYTMAIIGPLIGGDPDTTDKDGNGIIDVAQARLFDAVLNSTGLNPFCCVRDAYMSNRAAAQALLNSIPLIGSLIPSGTFVPLIAGVTTQGEQSTIDSIVGLFDSIPLFPALDLSSFDFSAAQYLASNGDPDYDWVCTLGEYTALVTSAADFDAFVAAALDDTQTANAGNCPPCPEGEVEGSMEGATEGQTEGAMEGETEGVTEGQAEGEGQIECTIDGTESYFHLMVGLGDSDGDGTISKDELILVTGWASWLVNIGWGLIDTDSSGELTLTEFSAASWLLDRLPGLDDNSDNLLTLGEVQGLSSGITQAMFNAADKNHNSVIDCVDLYGGVSEGEVEGTVEGQAEGEEEGQTEGEGEEEGQTEGEDCVLAACPNFDAEGTALYAQLAALFSAPIDWATSDIDNSQIPDSWEIALFQAVVCGANAGSGDPTVCTFLANLEELRSDPNHALFQNYENVMTAMLSISSEMQATVKTLGLTGSYEIASMAAKASGEPFSAQGDPDGDSLLNLTEFQAAVADSLGRDGYVLLALTPNATEGAEEGVAEGAEEGQEEGVAEGAEEGQEEGVVEGAEEGQEEGVAEGAEEGVVEGAEEGTLEGAEEGEAEGENLFHSADPDNNFVIGLSELLRVIQFFNSGGLHCASGTEDGYAPGAGDASCAPHSSDYNGQDWVITISELLRIIQFYNFGGYHACPEGEDGFCPGLA